MTTPTTGGSSSILAVPWSIWLRQKRGERILDLGCGDGVLTELFAASGADVLGADLSGELLAAAAAKRLKVQRVDGHPLPFESEFDAVFTKAALHWMRRPKLVIAGVDRALKPRGRFVGEFGGLCCGADQATLGALASPHPCQIHGRGHGLQGARRSARPDAGSEGAGHDATV